MQCGRGNQRILFHIPEKMLGSCIFVYCTALAIILLLRQAIKISRRIMEAENCYMALEEDSLAVCQPEKNGKYESCRIFYDEMDKIVEGSRRGIPEFLYRDPKRRERTEKLFSFWMKKNRNGMFFCVRSFGF